MNKTSKAKKFWIMFLIIMSYVIVYGVPILLLFFTLRSKFIITYVTKGRYSLSFLGFVTITSLMMLFLIFKVSIKLIRVKASIFKQIFFMIMKIAVVLLFVFILSLLMKFTLYIEAETMTFVNAAKAFIDGATKGLYLFAGCIATGSILNVIAIIIDKEYVKELSWL